MGVSAGGAQQVSPPRSGARQSLDDAWWTGPMLAPSANTLPQGHFLIEPYLYDVTTQGFYNVSGPQRSLGAAVDQAAYRIIQEALTNAARHGRGSARIELAFGETTIELAVTNPAPANRELQCEGHGLVGMRERATLLGGSFDADCANGTFRIQVRIPYGGERI